MANQYASGPGGYDPYADPNDRTLASGVNSGQALPNMDKGKVGNPYAQAANSIGQRVARRPMMAQAMGADQQAPPPAPMQPGPMTSLPASAPQQRQAPAMAPAPAASPQRAPPPPLQVSPTGQYLPPNPAEQFAAGPVQASPFDPAQFNAYGAQLLDAANGKRTAAQDQNEQIQFGTNYYKQGLEAANNSAGRGLTGVSGPAQALQQSIAGNIANALAQKRAEDTQAARGQYGQWLGQGVQQKQFEETKQQEELSRQQQAQQAFDALMEKLQNDQAQRELERKKFEYEQNKPWYEKGLDLLVKGGGEAVKAATSPIDW